MFCYCKRCGRMVLFLFDEDEKICDYCENVVFPIPEEFLSSEYSFEDSLKAQFIEEYIKSSPEFNQNLFDSREEYARQHANDLEKYNAALAYDKAIRDRGPKCPSCGSSNISKIGIVNRAVSVGIFGLASSKIGKTHICNNCGTTW